MLISLLAAAGTVYLGGRLARRLARPIPAPAPGHDVEVQPPAVPVAPPGAVPDVTSETDIDRAIRQRIVVSTGSLTLLVAGRLVAAPLLVPGLGLLLWSVADVLRYVVREWRDERRIGAGFIDGITVIGLIGTGYWVGSASIAVMASGVGWLTRRTERRSKADLAGLLAGQLRMVWLLRDGEPVAVDRDTLTPGDVIVVEAGMVIPVDGQVIEGMGRVDQQSMTGEARPVERGVGDAVLAATLLLEGRLLVEVRVEGVESAADEVIELLEQLDRSKDEGVSRAVEIIDRWVPRTLAAGAVAVPVIGPGGALVVLFSGIGYGLRYAGPVAMLNYMRLASRSRTLVRDGRALERLADVDVVVFDKTGTLTHETPRVRRVTACPPFDPGSILELVAAAERHQSHPIARALRAAAESAGLDARQIDAAAVRPGMGLQVTIEGRQVLVGSRRLLERAGVSLDLGRAIVAASGGDGIEVHVAIDGRYAGLVELRPQLRPEAHDVIAALRGKGPRRRQIVVLSGDHAGATRALAEEIGADRWHADVLPEGKARVIDALRAEGKRVCFVGDGINDTLALQSADVSISFHGASSIAESAASIVLLDGDLARLPDLFRISAELRRNIDRSFTMSLTAGVACIGGAFLIPLGLGQAVAIYNAGVVGCVVNALTPLLGDPPPVSEATALSVQPAPEMRVWDAASPFSSSDPAQTPRMARAKGSMP